MNATIKQLTREFNDHKEVEKELGQRSHFCAKVIRKLKEESKTLREEIEKAKKMKQDNPEK